MDFEGQSCPICASNYNTTDLAPRLIPSCGHVICSKCICDILKQGKFKCPFDRNASNLTNLESFPKFIALIQLIEDSKKSSTQDMCREHKEKLLFVCYDEQKLICRHCISKGTHCSHNWDLFDEFLKKTRKQCTVLSALLKKLKDINQQTEIKLTQALEERKKSLLEMVNIQFKMFTKMLQDKKNETTKKIEDYFQSLANKEKIYSEYLNGEKLKTVQESTANLKELEAWLAAWKSTSSIQHAFQINEVNSEDLKNKIEVWPLKEIIEPFKKDLSRIYVSFNENFKQVLQSLCTFHVKESEAYQEPVEEVKVQDNKDDNLQVSTRLASLKASDFMQPLAPYTQEDRAVFQEGKSLFPVIVGSGLESRLMVQVFETQIREEVLKFKSLLKDMDKAFKDPNLKEVYLVSTTWLRKWKHCVLYDFWEREDDEDEKPKWFGLLHPGKINDDLVVDNPKMITFANEDHPCNAQLKLSAEPYKDYQFVTEEVWNLLKGRYESIAIKRNCYNQLDGSKLVEVVLPQVTIVPIDFGVLKKIKEGRLNTLKTFEAQYPSQGQVKDYLKKLTITITMDRTNCLCHENNSQYCMYRDDSKIDSRLWKLNFGHTLGDLFEAIKAESKTKLTDLKIPATLIQENPTEGIEGGDVLIVEIIDQAGSGWLFNSPEINSVKRCTFCDKNVTEFAYQCACKMGYCSHTCRQRDEAHKIFCNLSRSFM